MAAENKKINYYKDAVGTLLEEIKAFDVSAVKSDDTEVFTETLEYSFDKLLNSSWDLLYQHKNLIRRYEKLQGQQSRIFQDNAVLSNLVKRLKDEIEKKKNTLSEIQEKERQVLKPEEKDEVDNLTDVLQSPKEKHKNIRRKVQKFHCIECGKHYERKHSLIRHLNVHHKGIRYLCKICKKTYTELSKLNGHTCTLE